jgi:ribonuclease T2
MRLFAALLVSLLPTVGSAAQARPDFDYYVLSLSWSPAYCLLHGGDRDQCTKGYGFVLHGLWPQYERGGYPQHCESDAPMTEVARKVAAVTYPSLGLARHEWETHGRCTGLSALDYFRGADKAFAGVQIPPVFEAPEQTQRMRVDEVLSAFRAANPTWRKDGAVITCKDGRLSEIRICLSKSLDPRPCGTEVSMRCRGTLTIEPVR